MHAQVSLCIHIYCVPVLCLHVGIGPCLCIVSLCAHMCLCSHMNMCLQGTDHWQRKVGLVSVWWKPKAFRPPIGALWPDVSWMACDFAQTVEFLRESPWYPIS